MLCFELVEFGAPGSYLACATFILDVTRDGAEHSPAKSFHPRIHRRDPLFIHIGDDGKFAGNQSRRDLGQEVLVHPGCVQVTDETGQRTRTHADSQADGSAQAPIRLPRAVPPRVQAGNCSSTRSLDTVPSAFFLITASEFTSMLPSRSSADKACTPS